MAWRLGCVRWRGQLGAHVDGALTDTARAGLERHLERCAACRQERQRIEALRGALRRLGGGADTDPAAARQRVFSRFETTLARESGRRARAAWAGACAGVIVASVGCGLLMPMAPPEGVLPDDHEVAALMVLHDTRAEHPHGLGFPGADAR